MSIHLRRLRLQRDLTLDELASAAELTRSYLSKIERGMSSPSIAAALRLAQALGVTVEQLFQREAPKGLVAITRASERRDTPAAQLVSGAISGERLSAFVMQPALGAGRNPSGRHRGEELVYVLEGEVELQMADVLERLGPGDCAHFDSTIPHRITSLGHTQARLLVVVAPDGDKPPRAARRRVRVT